MKLERTMSYSDRLLHVTLLHKKNKTTQLLHVDLQASAYFPDRPRNYYSLQLDVPAPNPVLL